MAMSEQDVIDLLKRLKVTIAVVSDPDNISTHAIRIESAITLDDEVITSDHANFRLDQPHLLPRRRRHLW